MTLPLPPFSLEMNPKILAQMIFDKNLYQIKLYSAITTKNCACIDHDGGHDVHISSLRMSENYRRLANVLEHYGVSIDNVKLIADLLMFCDAELDRQADLFVDTRLTSYSADQGDVSDNGSTVT